MVRLFRGFGQCQTPPTTHPPPRILWSIADIAVNNEVDVGAESTVESYTAKLGGCYLGLYRRDTSGKKIMQLLKARNKVPEEAMCRLDD